MLGVCNRVQRISKQARLIGCERLARERADPDFTGSAAIDDVLRLLHTHEVAD